MLEEHSNQEATVEIGPDPEMRACVENLCAVVRLEVAKLRQIIDDNNPKPTDVVLRDGAELIKVLVRLLECKNIHDSFGAPGDWGYGTKIGVALQNLYRTSGYKMKMAITLRSFPKA